MNENINKIMISKNSLTLIPIKSDHEKEEKELIEISNLPKEMISKYSIIFII